MLLRPTMVAVLSSSVAVLLLMLLKVKPSSTMHCRCEAAMPSLKALYDSTNGDRWFDPWDLSSLSSSSSCSTVAIHLDGRGLTGSIPHVFAVLFPNVTSNNSLEGTIPASLSLFGPSFISFDVSTKESLSLFLL
jgi:hypothetical protein